MLRWVLVFVVGFFFLVGGRQHSGVPFCVRHLTSDLLVLLLESVGIECAGDDLFKINRNANPFKWYVTYSTLWN